MKSYYLCLLAIVSLLGFSSCSKDDATEKDVRKEVKVTATFNGLSASGGVTTRAVDSSWETGDAIGLFMKTAGATLSQSALASNAQYTTTAGDGTFTNPLDNKVYFPFDKSNVDFISYYPYTSQLSDLTYAVDVTDQSNLASIDLMYADNVKAKNYNEETIELDFKHQLTKVVLKITNNNSDNTTGDFSAKIINARKSGSFSLIDGTLSVGAELADISFNVDNASKTAEAILLPVTDLTNKEFLITIGDISYSYSLKNSTVITSFAPSTKCEYNITIEPNSGRILSNVTATITDWTTVTENITADEVPVADADGGNTEPGGDVTPPGGGGGDGDGTGGDPAPGDGDGTGVDPAEPGDGDAPVPPVEGDGSKDNPYTIAQAINYKGSTLKWVKGYIVGAYTGSFDTFTTETDSHNIELNLALADSPNDKSTENYLPVNLEKSTNGSVPQKKFNLYDHPENLGKAVLILGSIGEWFKSSSTRISIIQINRAFLDGVEIK